MTKSLTRRTFLKTATAAGGGLMIGAYLPLGNARTAMAAGTMNIRTISRPDGGATGGKPGEGGVWVLESGTI